MKGINKQIKNMHLGTFIRGLKILAFVDTWDLLNGTFKGYGRIIPCLKIAKELGIVYKTLDNEDSEKPKTKYVIRPGEYWVHFKDFLGKLVIQPRNKRLYIIAITAVDLDIPPVRIIKNEGKPIIIFEDYCPDDI